MSLDNSSTVAARLKAAGEYLAEQLAESDERRVAMLTIGRQQRSLDRAARRVAALEAVGDAWRGRYLTACGERNRAEARVAEVEGQLDVIFSLASRSALVAAR